MIQELRLILLIIKLSLKQVQMQNEKPTSSEPKNQKKNSNHNFDRVYVQQPCYIKQLKSLIQGIEANDFSYLTGSQKPIHLIHNLIKNKDIISALAEKDVQTFLDLISSRIQFYNYSRAIYRELLEATDKLSKAFEYVGNRRNVTSSKFQTDRIFQYFVEQLETKPRKQTKLYMDDTHNKRVQVGAYMSRIPDFFKDNKWRTIIQKVQSTIQKKLLSECKSDNPEIIKIKRKMEYSKNIYKQNLMSTSCLGCTKVFIRNWNIYDETVNKVKLVLGGSISKFVNDKNDQNDTQSRQLKKQICGLLNYGGGSILFDCQKQYLNVIAKGQYITKAQASKFINKVTNILKQIQPSPKVDQNIFISFVPVLKDFIGQNLDGNVESEVEGFYVSRIVVRPTVQKTYLYREDQKLLQSIRYKSLLSDQLSISVSEVEENYCQSNQNDVQDTQNSQDWLTALLNSAYTDFDHQKCQIPYHGYNIPDQMTEKSAKNSQAEVKSADSKYAHATAFVVKRQYFQEFKKKLQKYNFDYILDYPFPQSKIKGANATVILYHDISHAQIKALISLNSEFQFGGRGTISVPILQHVKLISRLNKNILPNEHLKSLQLWVDSQFKGQSQCKIQVISDKNSYNQTQYYLTVKGERSVKKCTLFLYLLTNHFNERTQFRNPTTAICR